MKAGIIIIVLVLIGIGGFVFFGPSELQNENQNEDVVEQPSRTIVENGTYAVDIENSTLNWAGQKPLIEGYINNGTLGITRGSITVGDSSFGSFEIDMNTLSVSETKTKPGAEGALEGHLKGEGWFDVATYPKANFELTSVTPKENVTETFEYDILGNLTMKGETNEVSFVGIIYQNTDGQIIAEADFEIDRTKWGITAGSGSFFDNLADQVVDDMIALSFRLVANEGEAYLVDEEVVSTTTSATTTEE